MRCVILCGVQGAGKSTFYLRRFFDTHIRINLDMLRTRHRENLLLRACVAMKQPFVVDNTNATAADRARYIAVAKPDGFHVIGYYFESKIEDVLRRNEQRPEERRVPKAGIFGTYKRLQVPARTEGFDELWYVRTIESGDFAVEAWRDEV